ncbi:MAG: TetR/AcrR family transcriptional regulator [bacterium]|uniref:TetR/AcrR family transcriptional regulator n=1 Tax=Candidatus Aphodosoma intestinipullorum TaxID=2840674 RepID=A0A940IEH2_9BACT|nr:TetR/AcrR family transcriptional regulator [Candidatus Aphodosoma intestinipullorum]
MKDIGRIRESIITAAAALFERYGYEKSSMDEIARGAYRAKTSIYYHFKSKQEILGEILSREFSGISEKLGEIKNRESDNRGIQLRTYLSARMKLLRDTRIYRHYIAVPAANIPSEVSEVIGPLRSRFDEEELDYFRLACREGIAEHVIAPRVDPDAFSRMLQVTLRGLEIQMFSSEKYETIKETYEAMLEFIIRKK